MSVSKPIPNFDAHWLTLFAFILCAWFALFVMSAPVSLGSSEAARVLALLREMCRVSAADASGAGLFGMWALMALAMMAPSLVPSLRAYSDLVAAGAGRVAGIYTLLGGYLIVWLLFAAGASLLQSRLAGLGLVGAAGQSVSPWLNAVLLGLAGTYQFSTLKDACLSQCRAPTSFFIAHWRDGAGGALGMGLRLGVVCTLCCWALMLLGFVGGVMSLLWMGAATILMTLEKLPQLGRYVTRPLGYTLLLAACVTAGWALGNT